MKNTRLTTTSSLSPLPPPSPLRVSTQHVPVCTSKTSPRTCWKRVCARCRYTRGRSERTHGDPLSGHGVFQRVHTPHTTRQDKTRQDKTRQDKTRQDKTRQDKTRQDKTRQDKTRQDKTRQDKTQHNTTQHNTTHHNTTRRQRQGKKTETKSEEGDESEEDKTRKGRREKIHFQCGGAWPFLVDVLLCLVHPSMIESLACSMESSTISFSASWQVNRFLIQFFLNYLFMQLQFRIFRII